jgi:diguanylate cyclase (GGDEF)-like protein
MLDRLRVPMESSATSMSPSGIARSTRRRRATTSQVPSTEEHHRVSPGVLVHSKQLIAVAAPLDAHSDDRAEDTAVVEVEAVLDALPSPTVLLDPDGKVLLTNSAWEAAVETVDDDRIDGGAGVEYFAMARRACGKVVGRRIVDSLRALSRGERASVAMDYALTHPAGTRWYHLQASGVGQAGRVVVTHTDVTARVEAERTSAWRARHDDLTQPPNRAGLHELIDAELQRADRRPITVLFLDVDGFKDVNDCLGHEIGDDLLRQLAVRLAGRTRAEDTVGRLGGDEFVVLCRDCDTEGAEVLAERIHSIFDEPFDLGGRTARLTASIGIATAQGGDPSGTRSTDLVGDADLAMYAAKRAGRSRIRVFTPDLREAVQQKVLVAGELREAIATGQLVLHYQPILHLPTGQVDGVEALVRWQHPERGLIPPGDFIAVAEEYELIAPLTRWVLGAATRQTAEWARLGLPLLVSVNVSAASLASGTLTDDVAGALAASGLPASRLIVELTETTVAEDPEGAAAQFAALRISGVEVAIDDFGSGFSSLGQLVNIPAGVLKIDRSLVADAGDRRTQSAAAIAAVVALAQACGMRALAEGVETVEQLTLAATLGCTFAQGYHIARPMPADELWSWLEDRAVDDNRDRRPFSTVRLPAGSR